MSTYRWKSNVAIYKKNWILSMKRFMKPTVIWTLKCKLTNYGKSRFVSSIFFCPNFSFTGSLLYLLYLMRGLQKVRLLLSSYNFGRRCLKDKQLKGHLLVLMVIRIWKKGFCFFFSFFRNKLKFNFCTNT